MVEDVKLILSKSVEEVIASTLSLSLLDCASKLYYQGAQCRYCAASQREYYHMLKKNGLELAEKYDKMKEPKTFKLTFDGVRYIPKVGNIMMSTLDECTAIEYLKNGTLKESDFTKLPDGYLNSESSQSEAQTVEEIDEAVSEEQTVDSFNQEQKAKRPYTKRK